MREIADDYFRMAREFAAMAAEAEDPSTVRSYRKLATSYVRLARVAIDDHVDSILRGSQHRESTQAPPSWASK